LLSLVESLQDAWLFVVVVVVAGFTVADGM